MPPNNKVDNIAKAQYLYLSDFESGMFLSSILDTDFLILPDLLLWCIFSGRNSRGMGWTLVSCVYTVGASMVIFIYP